MGAPGEPWAQVGERPIYLAGLWIGRPATANEAASDGGSSSRSRIHLFIVRVKGRARGFAGTMGQVVRVQVGTVSSRCARVTRRSVRHKCLAVPRSGAHVPARAQATRNSAGQACSRLASACSPLR